jgi:hypothetical protein
MLRARVRDDWQRLHQHRQQQHSSIKKSHFSFLFFDFFFRASELADPPATNPQPNHTSPFAPALVYLYRYSILYLYSRVLSLSSMPSVQKILRSSFQKAGLIVQPSQRTSAARTACPLSHPRSQLKWVLTPRQRPVDVRHWCSLIHVIVTSNFAFHDPIKSHKVCHYSCREQLYDPSILFIDIYYSQHQGSKSLGSIVTSAILCVLVCLLCSLTR